MIFQKTNTVIRSTVTHQDSVYQCFLQCFTYKTVLHKGSDHAWVTNQKPIFYRKLQPKIIFSRNTHNSPEEKNKAMMRSRSITDVFLITLDNGNIPPTAKRESISPIISHVLVFLSGFLVSCYGIRMLLLSSQLLIYTVKLRLVLCTKLTIS